MNRRDAGYWHGNNKFGKENPFDLLATIIRSDNIQVMRPSLRTERLLKSLDASIAFFIELLQIAYKIREDWQGNAQIRASIAMANATFDYFLLARHAVILGYGPEAQMLYRGCFERMTRAVVFQVDQRFADRFWKGKQISQSEVNGRISQYLESQTKNVLYKSILESYRNIWKELSDLSHPNSVTLGFRTLVVDGKPVDDSVGIDVSLGGMSDESVISGITGLMIHVTFSLSLMRILLSEFLGNWNSKLDKKYSRLINMGFDTPLAELERQIDILEQHRPQNI